MEQASRIRDWCIFMIMLSFISQQVTSQVFICDSDPCLNGAFCSETNGTFFCACHEGFLAPRCTKDLCDPNPCMNGGTCTNDGITEDYSCDCTTGFTGKNCTDPAVMSDPCFPNPCENGGTCDSTNLGYTCMCTAGYTGSTCSDNVDFCDPNPCSNGGTCDSTSQGFTCTCPSGFTGVNCSEIITVECETSSCQNGGTCSDDGNKISCQCADGYDGSTCAEEISAGPGVPSWVIVAIVVAAVIVIVLVIVLLLLMFKGKKRKSTSSAPRGPPRMLSDFKTNTLSEEHDPEIQSVRGTFPSHSNRAFNSDDIDSDNNDPPPAYGDEDETSLNGFGKPRIYDNNKFSNNYTSYGPSASNRSDASSDEESDVKGNDMLY